MAPSRLSAQALGVPSPNRWSCNLGEPLLVSFSQNDVQVGKGQLWQRAERGQSPRSWRYLAAGTIAEESCPSSRLPYETGQLRPESCAWSCRLSLEVVLLNDSALTSLAIEPTQLSHTVFEAASDLRASSPANARDQ